MALSKFSLRSVVGAGDVFAIYSVFKQAKFCLLILMFYRRLVAYLETVHHTTAGQYLTVYRELRQS